MAVDISHRNAKRFAERRLDAKLFPFLMGSTLGKRTWY
jgi:hypothetical protein